MFEYAPRAIKLALVGSGAAEKAQVAHMITTLLRLERDASVADASDALAVAVCHAHSRRLHAFSSCASAGAAMIGSVRGRIASKTPPQLMVDVGGLGYELEAPMSTFFHLPGSREEVQPADAPRRARGRPVLYAFATDDERRLFRSLIKVSGVGPKIALALLSGISVEAFSRCAC